MIRNPIDDPDSDAIRFYFSFRSPYAWLAAERLESELSDLGVAIECLPIYPTPGLFPNDPASLPDKIAYMVQDIRRLTRERGLALRFPPPEDPDWSLSHAAFLGAPDQTSEHRLMLALFRQRFGEGQDLGQDAVLADAARAAGLDPDAILAAAHSDELRAEAAAGWERAARRDHIFGVPSFVYAGRLYWGQDRMHFLRAAVVRKSSAGGGEMNHFLASRRRLALASFTLTLAALAPIAPACANFGVPTVCLPACEEARDGEPCQQCLAKEELKREEARQKRAEARRQAPAPSSSGGGSSGGY
jgi:2-hydroxychromene-2-carboxylate isomerase